MKKNTIHSILNNICWLLLTLYPFFCFILFRLTGMQYYNGGWSNSFTYFLNYIGLTNYNLNSRIFLLTKRFLNFLSIDSNYFTLFFAWVLYIQFIRIIYNLCFFIFDKCHQWLECFDEDNENDLL